MNTVTRNLANVTPRQKQAFTLLTMALAAGYLWRVWSTRTQHFVIPGSRSTIPDEQGHYDMDGVSFDDKCGVVVGSDGRTPAKVKKSSLREILPRSAS